MNKRTLLLLSFLCLLLPRYADGEGISRFPVQSEAWGKMKGDSKVFYLQGVLDGLIFAQERIGDVKIAYTVDILKLTNTIDNFYKDPKNSLIPVPLALKIISMELSGVDHDTVLAETLRLRKICFEVKEADPSETVHSLSK